MKFASLFKKELREMLSPQTIIMLVFVLIVMVGLSGMVNGAMDEAQEESSKITICDLDDTDFSRSVIKFLKTPTADMKNDVKKIKLESDDYAKEINRLGLKSFIVVPEGFTESVNKGEQAKLIYVSKMTSLSTMSNVNSRSSKPPLRAHFTPIKYRKGSLPKTKLLSSIRPLTCRSRR